MQVRKIGHYLYDQSQDGQEHYSHAIGKELVVQIYQKIQILLPSAKDENTGIQCNFSTITIAEVDDIWQLKLFRNGTTVKAL